MSPLLARLFPALTRPNRKPARTRLGVEGLADRLVPAVTWGYNPAGGVTITGDAANNMISLSRQGVEVVADECVPGPFNIPIPVRRIGVFPFASALRIDGGAGNDTLFSFPGVNRPVALNGGPGDDTLTVADGSGTFDGGPGNDTMCGTPGGDVFLGSPGADAIYGNGGADVLDRRGHRGFFADGTTADTSFDSVSGKTAGRLSAAELKATGQFNTQLLGNKLYLTGPSGAGFALRSQWAAPATRADGKLVYATTADVAFETSWGDLTLPTSVLLGKGGGMSPALRFEVVTDRTPVPGVGSDPAFYMAGVPLTSQAARQSAQVGQFFSQLGGKFESGLEGASGADLDLPGLRWGVELGKDVGDDAAPLNPAVPYLFVTGQTGVSLGYENAGFDNGVSATLAYAPGDGTIYAGVTGLPLVSDLAIGVSTGGYLPYAPEKVPGWVSDPGIYGHLYVRGAIDLSEFDIPVAFKGEAVVDLDADDDGTLGGGAFTRAAVTTAFHDSLRDLKSASGLAALASRAAADVSVGLNADVSFSMQGLSVSLASGSFWRTPTEVAFKWSSNNPFEGIPVLGKLVSPAGYTLEGYQRSSSDWAMRAHLSSGGVQGMPNAQLTAWITSSTPVWQFNARVTLFNLPGVPYSPTVTVQGWIDPRSGDFSVTGDDGAAVGVSVKRVRGSVSGGVYVAGTKVLGF